MKYQIHAFDSPVLTAFSDSPHVIPDISKSGVARTSSYHIFRYRIHYDFFLYSTSHFHNFRQKFRSRLIVLTGCRVSCPRQVIRVVDSVQMKYFIIVRIYKCSHVENGKQLSLLPKSSSISIIYSLLLFNSILQLVLSTVAFCCAIDKF